MSSLAGFLNRKVTILFPLFRSMELSVKELEGKNYTLVIKNLSEMIDPAKSHWKVKTGSSMLLQPSLTSHLTFLLLAQIPL